MPFRRWPSHVMDWAGRWTTFSSLPLWLGVVLEICFRSEDQPLQNYQHLSKNPSTLSSIQVYPSNSLTFGYPSLSKMVCRFCRSSIHIIDVSKFIRLTCVDPWSISLKNQSFGIPPRCFQRIPKDVHRCFFSWNQTAIIDSTEHRNPPATSKLPWHRAPPTWRSSHQMWIQRIEKGGFKVRIWPLKMGVETAKIVI